MLSESILFHTSETPCSAMFNSVLSAQSPPLTRLPAILFLALPSGVMVQSIDRSAIVQIPPDQSHILQLSKIISSYLYLFARWKMR